MKKINAYTTEKIVIINQEGKVTNLGEAVITSKTISTNKGFFMLDRKLIEMKTGDNAIDFLFWIMRKMSNQNTVFYGRDENIAKDLGVCRQTVAALKKDFEERNLIRFKSGVIILNPDFIFRGNPIARENVRLLYLNFKTDKGDRAEDSP